MADKPRDRTEEERARAKEAVRELIRWIGDDPDREGLRDTPRRVVDAFLEYFEILGSNQRQNREAFICYSLLDIVLVAFGVGLMIIFAVIRRKSLNVQST